VVVTAAPFGFSNDCLFAAAVSYPSGVSGYEFACLRAHPGRRASPHPRHWRRLRELMYS
jgi:hypothetical protein